MNNLSPIPFPMERGDYGSPLRCSPFMATPNRPASGRSLRERIASPWVGPAVKLRGLLSVSALTLFLAACGSQAPRLVVDRTETTSTAKKPAAKAPTYVLKKGGGFYKDDGPGENAPPPEVLEATPNALPRNEPLHRFANKPYSVLGQDYVPLRSGKPYAAKGRASWYGRKFHGQKTSSGETYDMFGMSAAHCTLPIPSYVRVTNPANGKSVVLRVNDRGPFHADRIIDLSYTAAWKLELVGNGSGQVEVELIQPGSEPLLAAKPVEKPAVANTPASSPVAASGPAKPGAYLQLGAFGNPDNAEAFRAHIARELDWLSDSLRVEQSGKFVRVQAGPYRNRAEAESMAETVAAALGVKPTIVMR